MAIWKSLRNVAIVVAGVSAMAACAPVGGGNVVSANDARQAVPTELGRVIDAQAVTIQGTNDNVGTAAGIVTGAAVGSQIGGGTTERVIGGVVGSVVGGLVGNEVERAVDRQNGMRYTVRLDSGRVITVTQGNNPMIPVGARVQVNFGQQTTVTQIFQSQR